MKTQVVLYIYSFPSYLREQPRVKIGRTSGSIDADPTQLAWQRIRAQVKTSHPEEPYLHGNQRKSEELLLLRLELSLFHSLNAMASG